MAAGDSFSAFGPFWANQLAGLNSKFCQNEVMNVGNNFDIATAYAGVALFLVGYGSAVILMRGGGQK